LPPPGPLYAIADAEALSPARLPVAVTALAEAGVSWIQVRAKGLADDDLYRLLEETCEGLHRGGHRHVRLWVNDRADLATLFPVAGLHLGQTDLPPTAARTVVGSEVWIGLSTHDEAQLEAAARDPDVDVVAVGPVFPTTGKRDPDPVVGLDLVRRAREVTAKTVVAIGGIGEDGLAAVIAAGADTAAVLGGLGRDAVGERARLLLLAVRRGIS
jgi:thiamine-phosphate pyrophosphorylase